MTQIQLIHSFILNFVIILGTVLVLIHVYTKENNEGYITGNETFRYFTTLSNVFSALTAAVFIAFEIPGLGGAAVTIPHWLTALKFSSAVAVAVTFTTVMVFLGPNFGYRDLCLGKGLHEHVLGPIFAVLAVCVFEKQNVLPAADLIWGMIPVILYSLLYFYMVVVRGEKNGGWEDFYGFNPDGKWYKAFIGMYAGAFVLSLLLRLWHNA